MAIIAVTLAITLRDKLRHYIEENDDAVTNAVTFVPLVIGTQFLVRSLILWKRHRQRVKALREEKGRLAANGGADAIDPVTGDVFSDKCGQRAPEEWAHLPVRLTRVPAASPCRVGRSGWRRRSRAK